MARAGGQEKMVCRMSGLYHNNEWAAGIVEGRLCPEAEGGSEYEGAGWNVGDTAVSY